ncbi:hypothetical protein [Bradyrhizobium sp. ARR65]|uniref:hypothetical protein n=1 Tax=Bradyrhizobium sp. ARR65 TaxID=1040989 RepID=UPI000464D83B|nr:hypothetical protein [Bradyrhizobium sp. ARR65]
MFDAIVAALRYWAAQAGNSTAIVSEGHRRVFYAELNLRVRDLGYLMANHALGEKVGVLILPDGVVAANRGGEKIAPREIDEVLLPYRVVLGPGGGRMMPTLDFFDSSALMVTNWRKHIRFRLSEKAFRTERTCECRRDKGSRSGWRKPAFFRVSLIGPTASKTF